MTQQPDIQPLTRKQMRELRNTASHPIVDADTLLQAEHAAPDQPDAGDPHDASDPDASDQSETRSEPPSAPHARPADPVEVRPAPIDDSEVDMSVAPLTRRQARQQERIRTASVPVITPEILAAASAAAAADVDALDADAPDTDVHDHTVAEASTSETAAVPDEDAANDGSHEIIEILETVDDGEEEERDPRLEEEFDTPGAETDDDPEPAILHPEFGAELLAGDGSRVALPPSFDEILARGVSTQGSSAAPNALILSQTPSGAMMGPVAATGEILVTGTYALPEGLGSTGHAPGTADGKDTDAVLVDGELPAHSSPTPIAASSAISTIKNAGDVIRPPVQEKSGRLMMALAITAGVLALALVGVLIIAFVAGAF